MKYCACAYPGGPVNYQAQGGGYALEQQAIKKAKPEGLALVNAHIRTSGVVAIVWMRASAIVNTPYAYQSTRSTGVDLLLPRRCVTMATAIPIHIDDKHVHVQPGPYRGRALRDMANVTVDEQLVLLREGELPLPVMEEDLLFIHGEESFHVHRGVAHEDNPSRSRPLQYGVNAAASTDLVGEYRSKLSGKEFKELVGLSDRELWLDHEDMEDVIIEEDVRIIFHRELRFIAFPKSDHHDRYLEVTVLVDGEPRQRRFPPHMTVGEATRLSLPKHERKNAHNFSMVDERVKPEALDPSQTLKDAGVRSGDVLSVAPKHGGGG